MSERWLSIHYDYDALIGGGGSGLEGVLASRLTAGVRIPVTSTFGPFARVGLGGAYQGNDWYEYSHFDAPLAQVGAAFAAAGYSVEAGAQAAYTIGGRYITEVASRRALDGAPTLGGYAQIQLRPVVLRGEYTDYVQSSTGANVSSWTTRACVFFPSVKLATASPANVCFDGTWLAGGVLPPGAMATDTSNVYYFGISIGVGGAAASDRFKDTFPKPDPVKPVPTAAPSSPRTDGAPSSDSR